MAKNIAEETDDEAKEASKNGEAAHGAEEKKEMKTGEELKKGGPVRHKRKRGGKIPGGMSKMRMDRRARGGGTSDKNPLSSAGNMSTPDYERKASVSNGGGTGGDMSPYSGGSHRRPG